MSFGFYAFDFTRDSHYFGVFAFGHARYFPRPAWLSMSWSTLYYWLVVILLILLVGLEVFAWATGRLVEARLVLKRALYYST